MSRRIGEILVARGLLDAEQLAEALQVQLISGGLLGTSLLDLGYVDEETLGRTLADAHRVEYATRDVLRNVPDEVIQEFPGSLAEKHLAVPIKLDGDQLHLAVVAPRNLGTLSSLTGFRIVPWVAPEFRIYEALEIHYGVARRPRFLRLCREIDQKARSERRVAAALATSSVAAADVPDRPEGGPIAPPGETDPYGTNWREVAKELRLDEDEPDDRDQAEPTKASRRLEDVLDRMCRADCKEELSRAVLDYGVLRMSTCVLFSVRSQLARIWDCRGLDLPDGSVRNLKWPVVAGSIFTLLLGNKWYRGPVDGTDPAIDRFYQMLRLEIPADVFLYPVYLNDRLVSIVYGDNGPDEPIEGGTDEHLRLYSRLSLALNLLLLKMKIRAV
jgi:hypothetical protein